LDKEITVAMGASPDRPTSYPPNVVFFDTEDLGYRMDGTNTAEWGNGETLYIMVAVIDNGIGISSESQKKLFERFRQATPRTQEIYGGSGLGLNISRKICHLHGGEIGVSSKEGIGSVFGFFFKVRRTEVPPGETPPESERLDNKELGQYVQEFEASPNAPINENEIPNSLKDPKYQHVPEASPGAARDFKWDHTAEIASHVEQPQDAYEQGKRPSNSRTASIESQGGPKASPQTEVTQRNSMESSSLPKILLVEDNLVNQRLLRRKLEGKGFFVLTANNGREAVEAVKAAGQAASLSDAPYVGFSIILMDMEMPIMDGNAASTAIREWERNTQHRRVPILGVSANVRQEQKKSMVDAGMDDVIGKPYKIDEMVGKIRGLVGQNGSQREPLGEEKSN
jgi:CheY-like chemotaxis protein